jgi:ABC-type glutathione transport system ATPase component
MAPVICSGVACSIHFNPARDCSFAGRVLLLLFFQLPPAPFMIEARNLTKTFRDKKRGDIHAADNVSFRVASGQIYGLLGANGAGKTTTLRMLATLLRPSSGSALVAGFDILNESQRVRANVGFLAASTALYGVFRPTQRAGGSRNQDKNPTHRRRARHA